MLNDLSSNCPVVILILGHVRFTESPWGLTGKRDVSWIFQRDKASDEGIKRFVNIAEQDVATR